MSRFKAARRTFEAVKIVCSLVVISVALSASAAEPEGISDSARQQIAELLALKKSFTPAEQKLPSDLVLAGRRARGLPAGPASPEVSPRTFNAGVVEVEIKGKLSDRLLAHMAARSGQVKMQWPGLNYLRATIPLRTLHLLAEDPDIISIREPSLKKTHAGAVMSQGYISHRVRTAVAGGIDGHGVKVGI